MHALLTVLVVMLLAFCCCCCVAGAADIDHPHRFDPAKYPDRAAWERRRDFLRHQVLVAQGLWPMPEKTPLAPVVHGKIEREGYTIEKVFFASLPGHYVTGNLYRPTGRDGKRPVVLMPYGHWPNGRFIWRDDAGVKKDLDGGAEQDPVAARSPLQANCVQLARMGAVVFHYDMVGYGDNKPIVHREGFNDAEATLRLQSQMGLQTWNSIRALDFVLSLPEVDAARVAVAGSSGGGTQSIGLAAVEPERVAVSFPMVMISMNMQGGCVCENAPLNRVFTNNVELACLFAPKPQGAAAANDWTHDFVSRGLPEMKAIYRLFDAEANVEGEHFNFGHNHNLHSRRMQYRFLNKHLKLEVAEPIDERPFEPVQPKELSVYDEKQTQPADAADAAALRKAMTKLSDAQIAKLSGGEYVRTVRTALRAMTVDVERDPGDTGHRATKAGDFNGRIVIWWDPAAPFDFPEPLRRYAVYAPPLKPLSPATTTATATTSKQADPKRTSYAGFTLGYNRSPLAQQACDLLDLIARVRRDHKDAKSVSLVATGDGGPSALLARAIAGDAIDRAAIDLGGFDFDRVTKDDDPRMLPGALKYGGIYGIVPLCETGETLIYNARETGDAIKRARKTPGVTLDPGTRSAERLVQFVVEGHE